MNSIQYSPLKPMSPVFKKLRELYFEKTAILRNMRQKSARPSNLGENEVRPPTLNSLQWDEYYNPYIYLGE